MSRPPNTLRRSGMATGKPKFYWDSAPLIAWITDEQRTDPAEMAGLAQVVDLVDRNKAVLMTSVLWRAEVLDGDLTPGQKRKLEDAFSSGLIQELSIDTRIMQLVGEIRSFHKLNKVNKAAMSNIRTPDAIHLASAIHYGAEEFHTFDGKTGPGKNSAGLITLNGNVAGRVLKICAPMADQLILNFGDPGEDDIDLDADTEAGER